MPRGMLRGETRLQISFTRLKKTVGNLREKVALMTRQNREKDTLIASLQAKLVDKESQRKEILSYLYKPNRTSNEKKPLGKQPGATGYHRPAPPDSAVTEEYNYLLKRCPMCKEAVGGVVDAVVKYEEDIVLVPNITVKKHTITRHWCSHCETYVKSNQVPEIHRIGRNVLAYILYGRYRLDLPYSKIQESLRDLHGFKISEGEIFAKLKEAEQLFGKDYQSICELIKGAKVVHGDETGWRMKGENWWLWVFCAPDGTTRYSLEETRGKGVAEAILGNKTDRVIISDGYAVYRNLPEYHQECWVHLLRAAKLL